MPGELQRRRRLAAEEVKPPVKRERRIRGEVFPGDTVEYGLTVEIKSRTSSVWFKAGTSSTVQEDETGAEAWLRVRAFVDKRIEEMAEEYGHD